MSIKLFSVALCFLILFSLPLVSADETTESFIVYTERNEYIVGEPINVYVKAEAIDPNQTITVTDVVVYDPDNSSVVEWNNISIVLTDTTTPEYVGTAVATSEGEYIVLANATGCPWILRARWHFRCRCLRHIVPEVPLGTIMASVAMIIALVAYGTMPKWRKRTRIY